MRFSAGAKLFIGAYILGLLLCAASLAALLDVWHPSWPEMPAVVIISTAQGAEPTFQNSSGRRDQAALYASSTMSTRIPVTGPARSFNDSSRFIRGDAPESPSQVLYLVTEQQLEELASVIRQMQALLQSQKTQLEQLHASCDQPGRQTP